MEVNLANLFVWNPNSVLIECALIGNKSLHSYGKGKATRILNCFETLRVTLQIMYNISILKIFM